MAEQYLSMDNLRYVLYDVHQMEDLFQYARFQDHDRGSADILLDSVKDFSDNELFPYFREMDEEPAHFKDGKIIVHPQFEKICKQSAELGLIGASFDYEDGGVQLPSVLNTAAYYIMEAANNHTTGYPGLTSGSADLIVAFGSQELKDTYLPKMLGGDWGGTMCLTEPQAGSSLSDVTTSATPTEDGYYEITGQKIFISGGDHEYAENFVHLVLARIDGAPAGTKGISLFVVPKFRLTEDGGLEPNDVITAGDFQKLGQRGYCTTHLVFGENENCRGWLVGQPHKGLRYMFQMMNGARIAVGRGGVSIATAAYYASLKYAKERPQGRLISGKGQKDLSQDQVLIIRHPDVRRMLLLQKAVAEGSLSLLLQAAIYHDLEHVTEGEEQEKWNLLLEILTPIVKTYPAEMGSISVSNGLQVLGGYGFCSEFVLQQYYRDIRIMAIYEGTTGIQSKDLLGRKMTMKGGKAAHLIAQEMGKTMTDALTFDDLKPYAKTLGLNIKRTQEVMSHLMEFAKDGDMERYLADATIFMDFFSTIVVGWQWLKMAVVAKRAMVSGNLTQSEEFYESKIHTMKFYYKYEMPRTAGFMETLLSNEVLTMEMEKEMIG